MNRNTTMILLVIMSSLLSCTFFEKEDKFFGNTRGKFPIYATSASQLTITNLGMQRIREKGMDTLRADTLWRMEYLRGVHVLDMKDSMNTEYVTFIQVPSISHFELDGNDMIAASWRDIVLIDISDVKNVQVKNRELDVIEPPRYPPNYLGYFQCLDDNGDVLIGWKDTLLFDVRCKTN